MRILASLLLLLTGAACLAREPVRTRHAMVVAQEPVAAGVGVTVLKNGGNAVDAAVAVAFALAVTHPEAGNIGGGGFALVRTPDGVARFFDFRERAPRSAGRNMYLDASGKATADSVVGWRAAGTPGTVAGLEHIHRIYGRKPWAELVAPAIRLAAQGVELSYSEATAMKQGARLMERFPESKRIFLKGGEFFEPGEVLVQPELAETLKRTAQDAADFYRGETARRLAEASRANGGEITLEDLRDYKVVERKPLEGGYKGYHIVTAPPPSSGGVAMLEMLAMLEGSGYEKAGAGSAAASHYLAEVMRRAYADRAAYLGDTDFVKVPVTGLVNPKYAATLRASIDPEKATPSDSLGAGQPVPYESAETTHFNVIDSDGTAVALTYTINAWWGNGVTVPGLGFLLNNEMDDFAAKPGEPNAFGLVQGEANAIQPFKRPLSSMTPTMVLRDGKLFMVLGAPGGARIITGVMQVLLNVVDFGMSVQEAVDQPRLHHQWKPDKLYLEKGFSPDTKALLEKRGHVLEEADTVARTEAILIGEGWLQGAQNGRSTGKVAGY
ncbi:MAG: gamma-glutamyltransferase [Bryobacterales bacterium]|nr:gamma-glutamyltransferase [Bryobacterales bacterium]